jgi:hypothetical protein
MADMPHDCDEEVWQSGTIVFYGPPMLPEKVEEWITYVRADSKQRVDWSYVGGRTIVKAIGDIEEVHNSMIRLRDFYRGLFHDGASWDYMRSTKARDELPIVVGELDIALEMWPK